MAVSLNGAIVRDDRGCPWLLEEATDLETAWRAIIMASVTGSVGATESTVETNGNVSHYAKVRRLVFLSYIPQGVYGAHERNVDWSHPVLAYGT